MSIHEIPNKKQEQLLESLDDFSLENAISNDLGIFSSEEEKRLKAGYEPRILDNIISNLENSNIQVLTIFNEKYPKSLINLPERPLILFAKGDLSLLDGKCFAIVGTRIPSNYGKIVTEKFARKLAESGFVIVSGLCYGVDEIAHKSTLDVGGKTIAVIGSGFNKIYPSTNTPLAEEIAKKGLILSEYPPSFTPKKYTFPRRNRIVAGLSSGILITEAAFKSGTVHTKEFALEYGRDVFAIPGAITNEKSELTNHLIKTAQAECVTSPDDIISFYGMEKQQKSQTVVSVSIDEQVILSLLAEECRDYEFLSKNSGLPVNILNSCLTTLEIRGLIRKLPAQTYALI